MSDMKKTSPRGFYPIIGIIFLLVAILIGVAVWTSSSLKDWPLEMGKKMKALYEKEEKSLLNSKEVSNMKSVIYGDKYSSYPILDYYIASSFNSCAAGGNLDDYVSMGALETVIKQGARLIDLEIYMVDKVPVVALSPHKNLNCIKGTFNSLPLLGGGGVLDVISKNAFALKTCPNNKDPLFINIRIKSDRMDYNALSKEMKDKFGNKLLGIQFSYGGRGDKRLTELTLSELKQKVIIMCESKNLGPSFKELVNIISSSDNFSKYPETDANNIISECSSMKDEEKEKECMLQQGDKYDPFTAREKLIMVHPDIVSKCTNKDNCYNFDWSKYKRHGVQMMCMNYQWINDNKMKSYYDFFNKKKGLAFVLKPEHLRSGKERDIKAPIPLKKELRNDVKVKRTPQGIKIRY